MPRWWFQAVRKKVENFPINRDIRLDNVIFMRIVKERKLEPEQKEPIDITDRTETVFIYNNLRR
jgi:hypothetical protein